MLYEWNTFQRSKHEIMDSLPKLNSFFCIKLELGIKICTLVLALLGYLPPSLILAWLAGNTTFLWIVYLPVLVNVYTFGLASFALQWNKPRLLLIPAAALTPIWSLFSLVFAMMVPVLELQSGTGLIVLHLLFVIPLVLLHSILLAYYWVGLMNLYGLKKPATKPSGRRSLEMDPPMTSINEVDSKGDNKMKEIIVDIKESLAEIENKISSLQQ